MENSKERQYEILLKASYSLEDNESIDECLESIVNYESEFPLMLVIYFKKLADLVNYNFAAFDMESITEFMYSYFPDYQFQLTENVNIPYEKIISRIYDKVVNDKEYINHLVDKNCDLDNFELNDYCILYLNEDNLKKVIDKNQTVKIFSVDYKIFETLDEERIKKIVIPSEYGRFKTEYSDLDTENAEKILKIIIPKLNIIEVLKKTSIPLEYIYKGIDNISDKDFEEIIADKELYKGIENCEYVCNNKDMIIKLINNKYPNIIKNVSIELDDDIYSEILDCFDYNDKDNPKEKVYINALFDNRLFELFYSNNLKYTSGWSWTEPVKQYIDFTNKYGMIFSNILNNMDDINTYFDANGIIISKINMYFRNNKQEANNIFTSLSHNNKVLNNLDNDIVEIFKGYLIDKYFYELDEENKNKKYDYLVDKIGNNIIFSLDNSNIHKLLFINDNDLDKLFELFNVNQFDVVPYNQLYHNNLLSMLKEKFRLRKENEINIFSNINSMIVRLSEEELKDYIENGNINGEFEKRLDYYIKNIISVLELADEETKLLYDSILECKNLNETNLRKYCRQYLVTIEKAFFEENIDSLINDISKDKYYDKEDSIKTLNKYYKNNLTYDSFNMYNSDEKFINLLELEDLDILSFIKNIKDSDELSTVLSCLNDGRNFSNDIRKKSKLLNKYITKLSGYIYDNNLYTDEMIKGSKRSIKLESTNYVNILREVNLKKFYNEVCSDEKIYNSLKKIFKNYNIGRLPKGMEDYFQQSLKITLPTGINDIGNFINRYYSLLEIKKRILETQGTKIENLGDIHLFFSEVVKYISIVNSETLEVKRLFGTQDYTTFASNPEENSNGYSRKEREEKIVELAKYLYTLDKVTIPSNDSLLTIADKSINFIVGNRTNSSNICHGERTGACMRVGGVGEGLFLKCLTDKNWFHIRIENPFTNQYVSRVSGFRNGNTVYLNQLRDSCDSEYTNEDLQKYISIFANNLIEETKYSEYPIENVFINTQYAMSSYNGKRYKLGSNISREYNLDDVMEYRLYPFEGIWIDVKDSAYLLATTEEGKKSEKGYVDLKNGPENAEEYDCVRDKIYGLDKSIVNIRYISTTADVLYEKIDRVNAMKELLNFDDDILDSEDLQCQTIVDGYASSDWYVYIDDSNEIHSDYISMIFDEYNEYPYGNADKVKEEMEFFTNILKNKYIISDNIKSM